MRRGRRAGERPGTWPGRAGAPLRSGARGSRAAAVRCACGQDKALRMVADRIPWQPAMLVRWPAARLARPRVGPRASRLARRQAMQHWSRQPRRRVAQARPRDRSLAIHVAHRDHRHEVHRPDRHRRGPPMQGKRARAGPRGRDHAREDPTGRATAPAPAPTSVATARPRWVDRSSLRAGINASRSSRRVVYHRFCWIGKCRRGAALG